MPAAQCGQRPGGLKGQPEDGREYQREQYPLSRQAERRHPIAEGRPCERRVCVKGQISSLLEQGAVKRRHLALQVLHRRNEGADRGALGMERRVLAGEMILDEPAQVPVEGLVRDLLPGGEVEARLIQPPAEPLAVLSDEARDEPARDDRTDEQEPIKETTNERHDFFRARDSGSLPDYAGYELHVLVVENTAPSSRARSRSTARVKTFRSPSARASTRAP